MISYEKLNTQNHKITELTNVLSVLINDRSLCDSDIFCKLFYNYMDRVNNHMQFVNSSFYPKLLNDSSSEVRNTAKNFMSGSQEVKKIMNTYVKKWCNKRHDNMSIGKGQHHNFIEESGEMFDIILNRIQDEMEKLYPMVRNISNA